MSFDPLSLWLISGLILLISEMLTTSFFLIFIAIGCFAAALAASLDLAPWIQTVTCAVISAGGALTLRRPIQARFLKSIRLEADIGKEIRLDQPIKPHQQSRITYQGASWLASNIGTEELKMGDHVTIVGMDGNILLIRKVN